MYELEIYNVAEGWLDYEQYEDRQEAYGSVDYYNKNPRLIVKIREIPDYRDEDIIDNYRDMKAEMEYQADVWYDTHDTETGELL